MMNVLQNLIIVFLVWSVTGNSAAIDKIKNEQQINIEITTFFGDKQTYKQDDIISFLVSLDRDAYLLLIYQDAKGNLIQIIPNQHRKNNKYQQGLFVSVPDQSEPYQFKVSEPFGKETLWAFASNIRFPELPGSKLSNGLVKLNTNFTEIRNKVRSTASKGYYGEANTSVFTEPK